MSVRVMALVFDADIPAIELQDKKRKISAPTLKLVLLALADHCNDDGDGAYPSLSRIERKTALVHRAVVYALQAAKQEGLILRAGMSKRATVNYSLNLPMLRSLVHQVHYPGQLELTASAPGTPDPVHLVHSPSAPGAPEPSYNRPSTISEEDIEKQKLLLDLQGAARSVFGDNFPAWRKLEKELEGENVKIIRLSLSDKTQIIISGTGLKAAMLQDRYAKAFSRSLVGPYNQEVEVLFNE